MRIAFSHYKKMKIVTYGVLVSLIFGLAMETTSAFALTQEEETYLDKCGLEASNQECSCTLEKMKTSFSGKSLSYTLEVMVTPIGDGIKIETGLGEAKDDQIFDEATDIMMSCFE